MALGRALKGFFSGFWRSYRRSRQQRLAYERAMQQLHERYPNDRETTVFYALSLLGAAASPPDPTLTHQKRAGAMLTKVFEEEPDHPGVAPVRWVDAFLYVGPAATMQQQFPAPGSPERSYMKEVDRRSMIEWGELRARKFLGAAAAQ
jgi:hypothetical protein